MPQSFKEECEDVKENTCKEPNKEPDEEMAKISIRRGVPEPL